MLKVLLKKQLFEVFKGYFFDAKKNRMRSKAGIAGYIVLFVVIMDEPFVGLDPKATHILKGIMHDICAKGGAIFFSTHVLEVAEKLCDRVAIIRQGQLVANGTMEEVSGDASLEEVFRALEGENA